MVVSCRDFGTREGRVMPCMPLCEFYAKVVTMYMTTYSIWGPANFPSLEMPLTDSSVNQPHTESREYRSSPPPEREKSVYIAKSVPKSKNPDARKNVEVLYDDGKWYRGWLDSFNLRWVVKFQDDNETAEVLFPDKDVRLYNYILIYTLCYPSNEPIIMKPTSSSSFEIVICDLC